MSKLKAKRERRENFLMKKRIELIEAKKYLRKEFKVDIVVPPDGSTFL